MFSIGLGEPALVSAETGEGLLELEQALFQGIPEEAKQQALGLKASRQARFQQILESARASSQEDSDYQQFEKEMRKKYPRPEEVSEFDSPGLLKKPIRVSFLGRPNVGKSSLINRLLNVERLLVHEAPGTTRDCVWTRTEIDSRSFEFVDTAGYLNPSKEQEWQGKVFAGVARALAACDVAVFVLDTRSALTTKDYSILQKVVRSGKGLVLAVNKWDLFDGRLRAKFEHYYRRQIEKCLAELNGPPLVKVSALQDANFNELLREVISVDEKMGVRVPTGRLNSWLADVKKLSKLPNRGLRQLALKVIYQTETRPPTFVLFVNDKDLASASYLAFLRRKLAEQFDLRGVCLRLRLAETKRTLRERLSDKQQPLQPAKGRGKDRAKGRGREDWEAALEGD